MNGRVSKWLVVVALLGGVGACAWRLGVYDWLLAGPQPLPVEPPTVVDRGNDLADPDEFARLARTDPVAMLEQCLLRYRREVKQLRATLEKRERLDGVLHDPEVVRLAVRHDPLAVALRWEAGAREDRVGVKTVGVVYPDPEDPKRDRMRVWRPDARLSFMKETAVGPKDSDARRAARYCARESGLDQVMLRTLAAWKRAKDRGDRIEYVGLEPVAEAGGQTCHVLRRTCPGLEVDSFALDEAPPTDPEKLRKDGFTEVTLYVDAERRLQVGSRLTRDGGAELVGSYFYRDLELNPELPADTFTMAALKAPPKQ
jgi:hypothetical protein